MKKFGMFIGGEWVSSEKTFSSINPATEESIGEFQLGTERHVKAAIDAAESTFHKWSDVPAPKRGQILLRVASILKERKDELARLETTEMGKVLSEARADVQEAIDVFEYMAAEGRRLFGSTSPSELQNKICMTMRRPIGVVSLITPWNFPIAIPAWKISASLICGNSVVFKPSSDTPLCATRLVEILNDAKVPKGVVNLVTGSGSALGKEMVSSRKVRAVSFTGSRDTGLWITQNAGIKRVCLEMGGKNGIIVMDDADLKLAVDGIIWGAFGTTGQRCTACSRVIVHEKIRKKLERMIVEKAGKLRIGSGLDPKTDVGPLVNKAACDKVAKYVEIGKKEGASLLCGGKPVLGKGFFYKPTVFLSDADMKISKDEIFGPVLSIIPAKSLGDAIEKMNAVDYGLSSSIYTKNIENAMRAIEFIDTGITYVNSSTIGAEVHMPFGGVKDTGNGTREGGILGIDEFSDIKTIYIDYSGRLQKAQFD